MLYLCSVNEEESSSASTPSLDLSLIPLSVDDKNSNCNSAREEQPENGAEPKAADEAAKDQGYGHKERLVENDGVRSPFEPRTFACRDHTLTSTLQRQTHRKVYCIQ